MAYPSGTFSHASPGLLQVTFSGTYASWQGDFGTGASDIQIACVIKNSGGTVLNQAVMSRGNASPTLTVDYPGGSAAYTVEMYYLAHTISGAGWVRAQKLTIVCELKKR